MELDCSDNLFEQGIHGPSMHGFQCIDEQGIFTSVSKSQLEWLGYKAEELIGKVKFEELLCESDRIRLRRRRRSSHPPANVEVYDLMRKDRSRVTVAFRPFNVVKIGGSAPITMSTTMNLDQLRQSEEAKNPHIQESSAQLAVRSKIIDLAEFTAMGRRSKSDTGPLHRMPVFFRAAANAHKPNLDIIGNNWTYFDNCPLSKVLSDCLDHLAFKPIFQEKDLSYNVSIMHSSKILVNQRVMELVLLNLIESIAILALPHAQIRVLCHRSDSTYQILIKSFRRIDWSSVDEYYTSSGTASLRPVLDSSLPDDLEKAGLRVSLCREIVETFGGRVRSEYLTGPYATFVVQMPIGKKL